MDSWLREQHKLVVGKRRSGRERAAGAKVREMCVVSRNARCDRWDLAAGISIEEGEKASQCNAVQCASAEQKGAATAQDVACHFRPG